MFGCQKNEILFELRLSIKTATVLFVEGKYNGTYKIK